MPPQETIQLQPTREGGIHCSAWLGRIVCGDNTEVLSGFPAECVDLVVTSPPYDDLRTYGGHSWNFEALAAQLVRVLKPGGVIVWVVADKTEDGSESGNSMRQALHFKDVCRLRLHDTMIYEKENPVPLTHNRYEQAWEYCFVLSKGVPRVWNPITVRAKYAGETLRATAGKAELDDGHSMRRRERNRAVVENKIRGNVWRYTVGTNSTTQDSIAFEHPAVMPEALASDHIASWSNPGDVILDPFSGSGTTCKVAKALNRQWCGIEINPAYVKIAEARLSQDVLQLETCAMRPNGEVSDTAATGGIEAK
jgi:site-specific DNA-methyltransferase (adenine-specific)